MRLLTPPQILHRLLALSRRRPALHAAFLRGLLVLLTATTSAAAQYRFDVWTTDHGLPQNTINAICQTRDGYLWLATFGGLVRFDGVKFTVFNTANAPGLRSSRILALTEDEAGALWIGTEAGLTAYAQGGFRTYTIKDGLPGEFISALSSARGGGVWVGTKTGFARWQAGRITAWTAIPGLPRVAVEALHEDRQSRLWIGAFHGLVRFVNGAFTVYTERDGLPHHRVHSLCEDAAGRLWVGADNGGLARFVADRLEPYALPGAPLQTRIKALYADRQGALWIGTWREGMVRLQDGQAARFTTADGLAHDYVRAIYEDREGTLWIGTNPGGLNRRRERRVTTYTTADGLIWDGIIPILEDRQGAIWIGASCGGLSRLFDGRFSNFTLKDGLGNECVQALAEDAAGRLWIGTANGLVEFKDGRLHHRLLASQAPANNLNALYADADGTLWIGAKGGLHRLHEDQVTTYRTGAGLVHDEVCFITRDEQGALWVGTRGGVSRFEQGRFTNFTTAQGLTHDYVPAIHADRDGTVWLGTYGGGLNRLRDGRFTAITTREGLLDDVILRILEDEHGYLWLSGNRGVFRVSRQELNDFADGRMRAVTVAAYGVADGMASSECTGGGQPAGWRTRDGRFWFPTIKGVAVINPAALPVNPLPPPVVIEEFLLNRQAIAFRDRVEIRPGQDDFEIRYTGLSFIKPEHVRFKYQLVGLDQDWIDVGTRRSVAYSHLPPGQYTFRVIAANSDGVWNTTGAALPINIVPPFWRRWWFLALALLSMAGLLILVYEFRVARLRQTQATQAAFARQLIASQESERARIAAELHDSLGQRLIVIKNLALLLLQCPAHAAQPQLDEISSETSQALHEVKEISYNLRPHQLDQLGLSKTIASLLKRVASSSGIPFAIAVENIDGLFSKEAEINLYRIVQESVSNIVKHAGATAASVKITREPGGVRLTIEDNGRGFNPSAALDTHKRSFGLLGLAERVRMLGGTHTIRSVPGQGATITIHIGHVGLQGNTDEHGDSFGDRR